MKRLESLDVLRGLDMFFLVAFGGVLASLARALGLDWLSGQLEHARWEGFTIQDMIMPLFMFCCGVAVPYAFAKYRTPGSGGSRGQAYWRIARRFVVLWILGMIYQGNLLSLEPQWFKWYSNTLQAIAVGYAASALLYIHCRPRTQGIVAVTLLMTYWALVSFVHADGFGGSCDPVTNLCEWVDRAVLGSHRDFVFIADNGSWAFDDEYTYTWVLSSLNFIVTVLSGVLAGELLRSGASERRKLAVLSGAGALMIAAGLLWGLDMPVVKRIWTSSMTLLSSGICFILMGICYYVIDVRGWKKAGKWVLPFGMNAIFAYMIIYFVQFADIADRLVGGLRQFMTPQWYQVILNATACLIFYGLMYFLYKRKIFIKV